MDSRSGSVSIPQPNRNVEKMGQRPSDFNPNPLESETDRHIGSRNWDMTPLQVPKRGQGNLTL